MVYADRNAAGRTLGGMLQHLRASHPLVLGLPRGGVPVAAAVHEMIGGDFDVLLVRKLGVPWQPELAMGALGEGGTKVLNDDVVRGSAVTAGQISTVETAEHAELQRRQQTLRAGHPAVPLRDRTVVLVDDGMATGATMAAACTVVRSHQPRWIAVAVPVSSAEALQRLRGPREGLRRQRHGLADEVVCPLVPRVLGGVGGAYEDFHQLDDDEVRATLDREASPTS